MVILILAILGICFGSFINAFIWRFRKQEELAAAITDDKHKPLTIKELSITKGRSMCVHCHHELSARDLIPIVSYVLLRGKCRYCHKPIADTPLPELLTPLLFIVSYLAWPRPIGTGTNAALIGLIGLTSWLVFLVGFVALALCDIKWFELPHRIVIPLIGLAVAVTAVQAVISGSVNDLLGAALGGLIGGGLFFGLYVFSPKQKLDDGSEISKWIGGGDIALGFLLGWLVGGAPEAVLLIFLASLLGTLVAVPLMIMHKANRASHLPFGPYLIAAAIIVKLAGTAIIGWYTHLFLG